MLRFLTQLLVFQRHCTFSSVKCFILLLGILGGAGCQHADSKVTHQPRHEPLPPPSINVPLDAELRAAADRELSNALKANDPILRVHALEAIRDSEARQHSPDILRALADPQPVIRFAAALAAGELKLADAHDLLLAMADDKNESVRVATRFALHRLGDPHLSHDLEHMAQDPSPLVRGNTAFVLGMLGEPSAINILRVLRLDTDPAIRQQASEALWRLGNEEGLSDLVGLTFSRYPDDQMMGYLGMAMPRNTRIRQHVRAGLVSDYPEVSLVVARAMGMLDSDEGYGIAQRGAANADARQRVQAAFAFGAIGRSDAQDMLRKLLSDSDPSVRIAAATAVLQLKPPG